MDKANIIEILKENQLSEVEILKENEELLFVNFYFVRTLPLKRM